MIKNRRFIQTLLTEITNWVELGIITADQSRKIENLYTGVPETEKAADIDKKVKSESSITENINIARVIIGIATLCLAIGIVIFYASNWKKMPPVLKLVQIFILILSTYGASYWFLQSERRFSLVGRALLIIGIISYGTGIMLVAQVYHISSHPTNGLLAWGIGAYAISMLMKEKYGIYLSMLLFVVWDVWEYSQFGNPGYFFAVPVLLTGFLSYKWKDIRGLTVASLLLVCYFFQVSVYWIDHYATDGPAGYFLILIFVTAGALMRKYGNTLRDEYGYRYTGILLNASGWFTLILPVYHISALHSSAAWSLAVWASVTLVFSAFLRDRPGYYIAAILYFAWSVQAGNPVYGYIVPVIAGGILFYREKDDRGIALTALTAIYYLYILIIKPIPDDINENSAVYIVTIMHFPLSALLLTAAKNIQDIRHLEKGAKIFKVGGWFTFLVPFIALSWPIKMEDIELLLFFGPVKYSSIEYIIFTAASLAAIVSAWKKDIPLRLLYPVFAASPIFFFMPVSHTATRMISLHLAAIGYIFLLLYIPFRHTAGRSFEKRFALIFTAGLLVIKGAGFISYSAIQEEFKLAYLIGFILFVTICFLINRIVNELIGGEESDYPVKYIDAVCAAAVWISIYLASFRVEAQKSIFTADSIVIIMTLLFIVISVALYIVLFRMIRGARVILYLSLIIFASSGITLLTAGPSVPWEIYSITFNILLFVTSAVFMYYSSIMQSKFILNFATACIVIQVFTRYFDLFWDMFSGSLLFIITGIIGLAGGYLLEKKRENLAEIIESGSERTGEGESR